MITNFLKDEKGAIVTVEVMGYTLLIGGLAIAIGFGLSVLAKGKIGAFNRSIQDTKALGEPITRNSGYSAKVVVDQDTGIITGITEKNN